MLVLGCVRRRSSEAELGFAEGGVPLRLGFLGGVDKAMATAVQGNKVSRPLPRPGVALLQLHRRDRGVLLRSLGLVSLPSYLMRWLLAFFCFKDERRLWVVWLFGGGFRLSLSSTLVVDGEVGSRTWRSWGVSPVDGRFADGFLHRDSNKSLCAMGFSGSWRHSVSSPAATSSCAGGSRRFQGSLCIFQFVQGPLRSLVETAVHVSFMYVYVFLCVFVLYP